jgi:hypothetical protein
MVAVISNGRRQPIPAHACGIGYTAALHDPMSFVSVSSHFLCHRHGCAVAMV